jgi:hypothetical protein
MPRMAKVKMRAAKPRVAAKKKPAAAKKKAAAPKKKAKPAARKKPAPAAKKPTAKKPAAKKPTAKKPAARAGAKKPAPTAKPRSAGTPVDDYVAKQVGWQKGVITQLREILREGAPGATEELQGGEPVYDWNGPFAQIHALPEAVELGFWRGGSMTDPKGLLSGQHDGMKVVKITPPANVERQAFVALVREAVRLNDELGDPTRR